jgi:hypothetical protein
VNDKHRNLPPPEAPEPVVTYSRIGSRIVGESEAAAHDERVTPMFDAVEVDPPRTRERDGGDLGGQTLEDRLTGSGGGGRSLRFVMLAGVAAVVVGFGVLAVTFNVARQAPTAATASSSAPKKVTDTTPQNAIDMTPASAPASGDTEQASAPEDESVAAAKAEPIPADEPVTKAEKADDATASDVAAIDPVQAEPTPPPIPRTKPKVETPVAEKTKPEGDRPVAAKPKPVVVPEEQVRVTPAPEADDGMFVEEVEKRLATAPRIHEPTNEMSPPPMMVSPDAPPLFGPDVASERATVPTANSTPERLVPPADIPNVAPYDQANGSGDYYEPEGGPNGYEYGRPYQEGGWEPEAAAVPAPQWIVLGVRQGRAIVDGRQYGVFMVGPGSEIPGVGTVEAIEWRGNGWVVITSNGAVLTSLADSGQQY